MNEELDALIMKYFHKKNIPGFQISEIRLQINGTFDDKHHADKTKTKSE
jgi:hypothetical protein